MAQSDYNKRRELFAELIYYLFDSFLILLIRTNFHVTESNADKNRLYYFRHDIWRKLTEPALAHLKTTMFEEMKTDQATRILASRQLGYSQVRLLPKKIGARPITNLRRRTQIMVNGRSVLGRSINSVMKPVFNVLNWEKVRVSRMLVTRVPLNMLCSLLSPKGSVHPSFLSAICILGSRHSARLWNNAASWKSHFTL